MGAGTRQRMQIVMFSEAERWALEYKRERWVIPDRSHQKWELLDVIRKRQTKFLGHSVRKSSLEDLSSMEDCPGKRARGGQRKTYMDNFPKTTAREVYLISCPKTTTACFKGGRSPGPEKGLGNRERENSKIYLVNALQILTRTDITSTNSSYLVLGNRQTLYSTNFHETVIWHLKE